MVGAGSGVLAAGFAASKILITGSNGFVGRHFRNRLSSLISQGGRIIEAGRDVKSVDVYMDLSDDASVDSAFAQTQPDLVVHLAGQASVSAAESGSSLAWEANFSGSFAIARAIAKHAPNSTTLFISSAEVYGDVFLDGAASENDSPRPKSVYAASKYAAELMFGTVLPSSASLIIARPSNHIGPGQDARFAISSFARQIALIEAGQRVSPIKVGNLSAVRDFMDVRDVVDAYIALLEMSHGQCMKGIFNISSGNCVSVGDILAKMLEGSTLDVTSEIDPARFREIDVPIARVDSEKIRMATGWAPSFAIESTLADVMADARAGLCKLPASEGVVR